MAATSTYDRARIESNKNDDSPVGRIFQLLLTIELLTLLLKPSFPPLHHKQVIFRYFFVLEGLQDLLNLDQPNMVAEKEK